MLGAASAMIIKYSPDAPDAVMDIAALRLSNWLAVGRPTPSPLTKDDVLELAVDANSFKYAMYRSGAQDILSDWREVTTA